MRDFKGRGAFVTGGASGIGLALARAFLDAGMKVMLADIEPGALVLALGDLKGRGEVRGVVCDVSDRASVHRAAEETFATMGRVHVLCNNAGVGAGGLVEQIVPADWEWVLDVNLMGVIWCLREFLPHIKLHGESAHIVNTASMAGIRGAAMMGPYCASKFAVVGLSESLAAELADSPIGVSVLCPGWVRTRIFESRRNRPERYDPDPQRLSAQGDPRAMAIAQLIQSGLDPAEVAARVLQAIRDNDLYVFTHPEMRGNVEERFQQLDAAFQKATSKQSANGAS